MQEREEKEENHLCFAPLLFNLQSLVYPQMLIQNNIKRDFFFFIEKGVLQVDAYEHWNRK